MLTSWLVVLCLVHVGEKHPCVCAVHTQLVEVYLSTGTNTMCTVYTYVCTYVHILYMRISYVYRALFMD